MPLKYAFFMIFPALSDVLRLLRGGLVTAGLADDCEQNVARGSKSAAMYPGLGTILIARLVGASSSQPSCLRVGRRAWS